MTADVTSSGRLQGVMGILDMVTGHSASGVLPCGLLFSTTSRFFFPATMRSGYADMNCGVSASK